MIIECIAIYDPTQATSTLKTDSERKLYRPQAAASASKPKSPPSTTHSNTSDTPSTSSTPTTSSTPQRVNRQPAKAESAKKESTKTESTKTESTKAASTTNLPKTGRKNLFEEEDEDDELERDKVSRFWY
jgi:hypothetical protein